ncbi:MAG: hypothetical protein H0U17_07125 [Actinobacteria bacterium]|nr:hypothetical protein [Actinomycetota bacterium]
MKLHLGGREGFSLAFRQHVPRAFLFAWLITDDEASAARLAVRAFRGSLGSMQDLRGPDVLEAHVPRAVVLGVRRSHRRPPRGGDMRSAWLRLAPRTRAALVMLHFEDMDPRGVADVLECSDEAVARLSKKGLATLEECGFGTPQDLTAWLRRRAEGAPPPPAPSAGLRRSVRARRVGTVAAVLALAMVVAVGTVAGTTVALDRASAPPRASEDEDPERTPVLQRLVDDLKPGCPDGVRLLPLPRGFKKGAAAIAIRFNEAVIRGDERTVQGLAEPTAGPTRGTWASTKSPKGIVVTNISRVSERDIFTVACGRSMTKRSLRIVMRDRNGITREGLAFFYVAYTADGWRVWAADEPGA